MARVTVEDCVDKVPNRFDLVMLAAHRAREISSGSEITVPRDNDKNPVVALREIADETLSAANLHEAAVQSYQTQIEVDEPEEDEMALLMGGADDEPDDGMNDENLLRALMEAQESKWLSGFFCLSFAYTAGEVGVNAIMQNGKMLRIHDEVSVGGSNWPAGSARALCFAQRISEYKMSLAKEMGGSALFKDGTGPLVIDVARPLSISPWV